MLRKPLLVTNRGPREDGYTYCTRCGLIEPTALRNSSLKGGHAKPYPDAKEPLCPGGQIATGLALGTDFITDVLLIALRVEPPLRLLPGDLNQVEIYFSIVQRKSSPRTISLPWPISNNASSPFSSTMSGRRLLSDGPSRAAICTLSWPSSMPNAWLRLP
jgi:hypothetical protein